MNQQLIYMTAPTEDVAVSIAKTLLEEQLIACANIIPGVRSLYRWNGSLQDDPEVVMVAKTMDSLISELNKRVSELHPYDCPCVVGISIDDGHPPFLDWIKGECK